MTRLGFLLAVSMLAPSLAVAQSADDSVTAPEPVLVDPGDGGADDEAHALFAAGEVAFREGRYENALSYFQQAYDLSTRAVLLYNIGVTAGLLRRDAEAISAFERYLAEVPNPPNRGEVEARLEVLRRAAAERQAQPVVTTPETPATSPPPPSDPGPGPWVTLGIGAAVAIAGAVLLGVAAADVSSVENAPLHSSWSSVSGAYERSEPMSIAGATMIGVGAAAMIGGLAWGLSSGGGSSTEQVSVGFGPSGVVVRGTF